MQVLSDKKNIAIHLNAHIKKFGYRPEHHLYLYLYDVDPGYELTYFDFDEDGGIVLHRKEKRWYIIDEPLALPEKKAVLFLEVLKYIFSKQPSLYPQISIEKWTKGFRDEVSKILPSSYRMIRPNTVYYSPIINLEKFDETLAGGHMKGLRYVRNHFLKNYKIEIKDAREAPTDEILRLLKIWTKMRTAHDKVWAPDYVKFIQDGFPECVIKRVVYTNGTLRGLSVGWKIPNSEGYYIYIDIHDYSDEYIGEFVSLDHILETKKMGFKYLDFGGSDKGLLNFKKKFHPEYVYKTYNFTIKRD